ncbi:methyltransferase domain-containing protein (plasmid) [Priestia megaterium]|jgi:23S rRNA (guanine745-N1)-methyltransferase|nr:methyltransferase domain-containing protein [Priestia megaterium]
MNEVSSLTEKSKKLKNVQYVGNFEHIFKCPICDSSMKVCEFKSLICSNNHTFDFAKQGYLNLMTHPIKTKYNKELFEARKKLIVDDSFFEPLSQTIVSSINKESNVKKENISILDMGCGEGSHLSTICNMLKPYHKKSIIGVGIDLSKEGVLVASRSYNNKVWAVADLANTPFKDKQFDVILNILSPSNYGEFNRLLKNDGLIIKVVPQKGYLKELREAFYSEDKKQSYSNKDTVERFKQSFDLLSCSSLYYKMTLNKSSIQSLLKMTPLTWAVKKDKMDLFMEKDFYNITINLEILIGKKKIKREG